jgi:hypothetical protein
MPSPVRPDRPRSAPRPTPCPGEPPASPPRLAFFLCDTEGEAETEASPRFPFREAPPPCARELPCSYAISQRSPLQWGYGSLP